MKIILLSLLLGTGLAYQAQAQAALVNGISSGIMFGRMMHKKAADKAAVERASTTGEYQGKHFPMQRTPADKLPKKGAEQISALETELDRSHAALLASTGGPLYTPEQRTALEAAIVNVAKVQKANVAAYQQEAAFYLAEDARRQQAAAPAAPAVAPTN